MRRRSPSSPPGPGDDVLVTGFGPGDDVLVTGFGPGIGLHLLAGRPRSRKPDSGHIGTVSLTDRRRWAGQNAMKPRIQCVVTQWNPGFTA